MNFMEKEILDMLRGEMVLYVFMVLGYLLVWWWKIIPPERCDGIYAMASFMLSFTAFSYIGFVNLYDMEYGLLLVDVIQKVVSLLMLGLLVRFTRLGFEWLITVFSLLALPNLIVIGIPLFQPIYAGQVYEILGQLAALQRLVWYTIVLVLCEYRATYIQTTANIQTRDNNFLELSLPHHQVPAAEVVLHENAVRLLGPQLASYPVDQVRASSHSDAGSLCAMIRSYSDDTVPLSPSAAILHEDVSNVDNMQSILEVVDMGKQVVELVHVEPAVGSSHDAGSLCPITRLNSDEITLLSPSDTILHEDVLNVNNTRTNIETTPQQQGMHHLLVNVFWATIRNPSFCASILGIMWSLISFRWHISMPNVVESLILRASDAALILSAFSLGLFMASQPRLISCGMLRAVLAMLLRFAIGPAITAAICVALGVRGEYLKLVTFQAALPLMTTSFTLARGYNVHPDIMSTAISLGMLLGLPVELGYFTLFPII